MSSPAHQPPSEPEPTCFRGIVTRSPRMLGVFELVRRAAPTDATVLVRGETGTGKELVARALHDLSRRADRPFRAVNCATLSGELLASELFGHVRGAFTGATHDHEGLFAQCDGGTLFLDEIADLPLDIQPKLLRVLQDQTYVPVGGATPRRVDVRLIAATHKALRREVAEGRFRSDLMYRVRVAPLFLPPLREREGDVEALARHFVRELNARGGRQVVDLSGETVEALRSYPWPGNVRELRNAIEACFTFGAGPVIEADELPPELRGEPPPALDAGWEDSRSERRRRIREALRETAGGKAEAAERLGVSRTTLWRWMRELGIG